MQSDGYTHWPTGVEVFWVISLHLVPAIFFAAVLARQSRARYRAFSFFIILMVGGILGHLQGLAFIVLCLRQIDPHILMRFFFEYYGYVFSVCTTLMGICSGWLTVEILVPMNLQYTSNGRQLLRIDARR